MKFILKYVKWFLISAAVLCLCGSLLYWYHSRFVELTDQDMIFEFKQIPREENAYYDLLAVLKSINRNRPLPADIQFIENVIEAQGELNTITINELVTKYIEYIDVIQEIAGQTQFFVPHTSSYRNEEFFSAEILFLAKLEIMNIRRLLNLGQVQDAYRRVKGIFRFSEQLKHSQGGVVHYLIGCVINQQVLKMLEYDVKYNGIEFSDYIVLDQILSDFRVDYSLKDVIKIEYTITASRLNQFVIELFENENEDYENSKLRFFLENPNMFNFIYNEHTTRNTLADYFRQALFFISGTYADLERYKPVDRFNSFSEKTVGFLTGNYIGKRMCAILVPDLEKEIKQWVSIEAQFDLLRLYLAVRQYRDDLNQYPQKLSELAPNYISEIPKDNEFKKLSYNIENKLITFTIQIKQKEPPTIIKIELD